jgi:hypothetical protein
MGLNIELRDEPGDRIDDVDDPTNLLKALLPMTGDHAYPFLGSIDPYGDTTFNGLQMERFLMEWATVSRKARTAEEQALVAAVESFALAATGPTCI